MTYKPSIKRINPYTNLKWICSVFVVLLTLLPSGARGQDEPYSPRVFLYDSQDLAEIKKKIFAGDRMLSLALDSLRKQADRALTNGPWSVMDKPFTPPSGDKHDYMSIGPYWWPNPDTEDGLPYVRRDGLTNPERNAYDRIPLAKMTSSVSTLALAYYFTDHQPYASHASMLLRTWFLDEETHMNPHLEYGQAIPGRTKGRGIGIIDSRRFAHIADAIGLIEFSGSWTIKDQEGMEKWFGNYLNWLLNSDHGRDEASKKNNHGTFYDILTSHLALFVNNKRVAKEILGQVPQKRIAVQIEPDGSQPLELSRTRAFTYSSLNLQGLFRAALLAEHVGLDLWHFRTPDGRSLKAALDFLIPFALQEKEWPYQMIRGWEDDLEKMVFLLRIGAQKFQNDEYEQMIQRLPGIDLQSNGINLVYPKK
ncbi:alginate lyase [candidate division KSB1 bacterium]|nr:alginate lyase [candidate division KSB1 bacterium]